MTLVKINSCKGFIVSLRKISSQTLFSSQNTEWKAKNYVNSGLRSIFLNFLLLSDDKIFTGYKPNGIQPKTRRRFEVNRLKGV